MHIPTVHAQVLLVVDAPNSANPLRMQHNGRQPYSGVQSQTFDLSSNGDSAAGLTATLQVDSLSYWYETADIDQQFNDDYMGEMNGSGNTATWTVSGYPVGAEVEVFATWRHQSGFSTASPYSINGAGAIMVNHSQAASADLLLSDPAGGSEAFQLLGSTSADSNGQVQVILSSQNLATPVDALAFRSPSQRLLNPPIASYRFDELEYGQSNSTVADSIGQYDGTAVQVKATPGLICNAVDMSPIGIEDYISLDPAVLDQSSDFSISLWSKTSNPRHQAYLSATSENVSFNELLMWISGSLFSPFLNDGANGNIAFSSIADDQWHHLVWTRSGTNNCIYIDKVLQGCLTLSSAQLDIVSLIMGQEQDSTGGRFVSSQAVEGLIDELLIFDSAISPTEVAALYDNQLAGLNFDGSRRDCPLYPAALEYRFDENSWNGSPSEVLDSSAERINGTAMGGLNTARLAPAILGIAGTCGYAEFDGVDDYVAMGNPARLNFSEQITLSAWIRPDTDNGISNIIAHGYTSTPERAVFLRLNGAGQYQVGSWSPNSLTSATIPAQDLGSGNWVHLAGTYDGNTWRLYRNGLEVASTSSVPGAVSVSEDWAIGARGTGTERFFDGGIDEVRIYDRALSQNQIQQLMDNTRACFQPSQVIAGRVTLNNTTDKPSFTSVCFDTPFAEPPRVFTMPAYANGNDRIATRIRNVTTNGFEVAQVESPERANPSPPDGNASQILDFLAIPEGDYLLDGGAKMRVSSIATTRQRGTRVGLDNWESVQFADMGFSERPALFTTLQTMNNESNPFPSSEPFLGTAVRNVTDSGFQATLERSETSTGAVVNNEEIAYLAVTADINGQLSSDIAYETILSQRYVNGINNCRTIPFIGDYANDIPWVLGDKNSLFGSDGGWLRRCSLSASEAGFSVTEDRDHDNDTGHVNEDVSVLVLQGSFINQTCAAQPSSVHHYRIEHDGQGLTCDAEQVVVKACQNESCSQLSTQLISADLLVDGASYSSVSFTGSTTVEVSNSAVETITFGLDNVSIGALNPFICNTGTSNSCEMTFSDAGFRFIYGPSNDTRIANQVSGDIFTNTLKVQAVKDNNGVCTGVFSGNTSIELSQENLAPNHSNGLTFSANGNTIAKHPASASITLDFASDSTAIIPNPIYFDAGQIRLHANYKVSGVSLSGSSNPFWVSPAELVLSATASGTPLNGGSATANPVHAAGEDFSFTVNAVNRQGASTPNYEPGQLQLSIQRRAPTSSGSTDGNFSYANSGVLSSSASPAFQNVNLNSFVNGISAYDFAQYSEVGLLNIDIQDSNYGNANIAIAADAINVGRFVPHHFRQNVADNGLLFARCGVQTAFAAYSGQRNESNNSLGAITYLTAPILEISAYNKQGNITQNYHQDSDGSGNDFMRLNTADIAINAPLFDQVATGADTSPLPLVANMSGGTLSQNDLTQLPNIVALPRGVLHYQFAASDNFYYQRNANALVSPFIADIDFSVSAIIDADSVSAVSTETSSPIGLEIRFGRLIVENSFGPETANIPQSLKLEHYNGTVFVSSSDNNCTAFDASNITLSNISLDPALSAVLGTSGRFTSGRTNSLSYQGTGAGNQGQMGVMYDSYDWLKYDWDFDGEYNDNPTAVLTFGQYRGDDRLIHWREQF